MSARLEDSFELNLYYYQYSLIKVKNQLDLLNCIDNYENGRKH